MLAHACSGAPTGALSGGVWDGPKRGAPALWHVRSETGEAWLFGGIHALPRGLKWITPQMQEAIETSDRLVIEVLGLEQPAEITRIFQQMGNSPGQSPLAERLPPDLREAGEAL
ncbi:TraB/GumN family protein, partial [Blastomonas sp.]|uniref:TraB/GumN family protein n=1 Tax=Blastomonas sp. TaxID=1909299 RepID=UPI0035938CB3